MDKQQIIDYIMNTPGNTNPNVLESMLGDSNSDSLSIAEVKFINETTSSYIITGGEIIGEDYGVEPGILYRDNNTGEEGEVIKIFPLYNNKAYIYFIIQNNDEAKCTGNITQLQQGIFQITGDGTITFSSKQ